MVISKLKKDMSALKQMVVEITRAKRASSRRWIRHLSRRCRTGRPRGGAAFTSAHPSMGLAQLPADRDGDDGEDDRQLPLVR